MKLNVGVDANTNSDVRFILNSSKEMACPKFVQKHFWFYPYLSFLEIKKAHKFGLFNQIINDKILYLRR